MTHMKKLSDYLAVLAAALFALVLASGAHAQIVTFNTIVANTGGSNINFTTGNNVALSQTFSNVAELNSLTYAFVENGTDTTDQTISAYLVQWNTTNNSVMSTITTEAAPNNAGSDFTTSLSSTPLQSFVVPPAAGDSYGSWSTNTYYNTSNNYQDFQETLNINTYLDPSLTYAVVLIDTSGANGTLGLPGVVTIGNSFNGYGTGYSNYPAYNPYTSITAMEGSAGNYALSGPPYTDYGFSQIALVPGNNIVPTPEPRMAAAILCALFVAALFGRQLILRRQESVGGDMPLAA